MHTVGPRRAAWASDSSTTRLASSQSQSGDRGFVHGRAIVESGVGETRAQCLGVHAGAAEFHRQALG